jgi:hypothetical protein
MRLYREIVDVVRDCWCFWGEIRVGIGSRNGENGAVSVEAL